MDLDALPSSVKMVIGVMLGMHALAFAGWMVMLLRERSNNNNEKEKQS